ncbi:glycosyltransferase [Vibrio sp. B1Z05]|uniref:glycosyltransferase n=1 Tax=Vibrio sp. B1Z05 TaxID=2654980 RepID=UPI00128BBE85|nr:glycosyltransferase [Vibrio sp. B1Z05]MPW36265.1 glycosyltransferase [Vibrio sp. B1Z05]
MRKLVLFTTSYPFGKGESFLTQELQILSQYFDINIVPTKKNGEYRKVSLPENISIDNSIANMEVSFLDRVTSFIKIETSSQSNIFKGNCSIPLIKYKLARSIYVYRLLRWLMENGSKDVIYYSYWHGPATYALSLYKKKYNNNLIYISKAHGGDIYEYRHRLTRFPWLDSISDNINMLYPISSEGLVYIKDKYNGFSSNNLSTSRLGIKKSNFRINYNNLDSKVVFASCSSIISVKRVFLIYQFVNDFAKQNSNIAVEWLHIGDGDLYNELQEQVNKTRTHNLQVDLLGFIDNDRVKEIYIEREVNFFVNLSSSEGIPVSIMEAQSVGIPCICLNVGAISEIVNNNNGFIYESFTDLMNNKFDLYSQLTNENIENLKKKSFLSKESQRNNYSLDNYVRFAEDIINKFY